MVDGMMCMEVQIYGSGSAGTNDIAGTFLLTRGSPRKLFRLDENTGEIEEVSLSFLRPPAPEPVPEEGEEVPEEEDAED